MSYEPYVLDWSWWVTIGDRTNWSTWSPQGLNGAAQQYNQNNQQVQQPLEQQRREIWWISQLENAAALHIQK